MNLASKFAFFKRKNQQQQQPQQPQQKIAPILEKKEEKLKIEKPKPMELFGEDEMPQPKIVPLSAPIVNLAPPLLWQNEPEVDTNVISISFEILKGLEKNLGTGDPIFCNKCKASLNSLSKIIEGKDYLEWVKNGLKEKARKMKEDEVKKEDEKKIVIEKEQKKIEIEEEPKKGEKIQVPMEFKEDKIIPITEKEKVWVCEFCLTHNKLNIEKEEIPSKDDLV